MHVEFKYYSNNPFDLYFYKKKPCEYYFIFFTIEKCITYIWSWRVYVIWLKLTVVKFKLNLLNWSGLFTVWHSKGKSGKLALVFCIIIRNFELKLNQKILSAVLSRYNCHCEPRWITGKTRRNQSPRRPIITLYPNGISFNAIKYKL